jgi:2-iminobutanoate/2-iminopropanoate deaminase
MPKTQIVSPKIRQPSGHFSQATMIEARGRLVFISGMTARRADGSITGIGDIEAQTQQVIAQALSQDQLLVRVSITWAAS